VALVLSAVDYLDRASKYYPLWVRNSVSGIIDEIDIAKILMRVC